MTAEELMDKQLYRYAEQHLWAGIPVNRRKMVELIPVADHALSGTVRYQNTFAQELPYGTHKLEPWSRFLVYSFSMEHLSEMGVRLRFGSDRKTYKQLTQTYENYGWQTPDDILQQGLHITLHSPEGNAVIPRSGIHFTTVYNNRILVAVDTVTVQAVLNRNRNVALNAVIESGSPENIIRPVSFYSKYEDLNARWDSDTPASVFVDGYPRNIQDPSELPGNSLIDIFKYQDQIHTAVDIDPETDLFYTGSQNARLVHIPKSANPDRRILPADCSEVYVFDKNDPSTGAWIHRLTTDENNRLLNVTFSDFGIPVNYVDQCISDISSRTGSSYSRSDVRCQLIVRDRNRNRTAGHDRHYLRYLYLHDDERIKDILLNGVADYDIGWSASDLVQDGASDDTVVPEKYADNGTEFNRFNTDINTRLEKYTRILGEYNTADIVCPRVQRFAVNENSPRIFSVNLPATFNEQYTDVHLYLNGLKVNGDYISVEPLMYSHYTDRPAHFENNITSPALFESYSDLPDWSVYRFESGHRIAVTVSKEVDFNPADDSDWTEMVVELFENPEIGDQVIQDPSDGDTYDFDPAWQALYQRTPVEDLVLFMDSSYSYSWQLIDHTSTPVGSYDSTDNTFTFNDEAGTFLIAVKTGIARQEPVYFDAESLNTDAAHTDPLIVDLTETVSGITYPILGAFSTRVFLNGYTLTEGMDYTVQIKDDDNDNRVATKLIIQNLEFVQASNRMEIYIHYSGQYAATYGFAEPETPYGIAGGLFNNPNLSLFVDDGRIVWSVQPVPEYILNETDTVPDVPDTVFPDHGSLCSVRYMFPQLLLTYIDNMSDQTSVSDDKSLRSEISAYLETLVPERLNRLFVSDSHDIYSLFICYLVKEIQNGNLTISDHYTTDDMSGLISEYEGDWMENTDLALSLTDQEQKFVDIYPFYSRAHIPDGMTDTRVFRFIQDVMRYKIDYDRVSHRDIVPDLHIQ